MKTKLVLNGIQQRRMRLRLKKKRSGHAKHMKPGQILGIRNYKQPGAHL